MRTLTPDEIREYKTMSRDINIATIASNVIGSIMFLYFVSKDGTVMIGEVLLMCAVALFVAFLIEILFWRPFVRKFAKRIQVDPKELIETMGKSPRPT